MPVAFLFHIILQDYSGTNGICQFLITPCHFFQATFQHGPGCHFRCKSLINNLKRHFPYKIRKEAPAGAEGQEAREAQA